MKLEDYLEGTVDNRGRNPEYLDEGKYPIIDNVLIKNALYPEIENVTRFIDEETFQNFLRGYVHRNMPIMTLVGNGIGNVSLAPSEDVAIVQNTIGFQVNAKMDEVFLYYYLLNNQGRIRNFNRGSGQPSVKKTDVLGMDVDIPDIKMQKKIADVLYKIDKKIHINKEVNKNLFEQAQTFYKAWFINYLPFSDDGTMPSSWKTGTVDDIITIHDSKRIPLSGAERSHMEKLYPYYGASSLMDYVDNYIFDGIYLLLGEDGTVIDEKGFPILQYVDGKFWVNNHTHILTGNNGFSVEELYLFFSLTNIKGIVTGAVQQKVSQGNLKKVPAIIPPKDVLNKFDEIIQPMFRQIRKARHENSELESVRDSLLPRLMSGELDVSAIDL